MISKTRIILPIVFILFAVLQGTAQNSTVQIKTLDKRLRSVPNIGVGLAEGEYFNSGNTGQVFAEVPSSLLPPQKIFMQDQELEAESWNYSKGVLEIIVRKKTFRELILIVRNESYDLLPDQLVIYNGQQPVRRKSNENGLVKIPVPRDLKKSDLGKISVPGYTLKSYDLNGDNGSVVVSKLKTESGPVVINDKKEVVERSINYDLSFLDTITTLPGFYISIRELNLKELPKADKDRVDQTFYDLLAVDLATDQSFTTDTLTEEAVVEETKVIEDLRILLERARDDREVYESNLVINRRLKELTIRISQDSVVMSEEERQELLNEISEIQQMIGKQSGLTGADPTEFNTLLEQLKETLLAKEVLQQKLDDSIKKLAAERDRLFKISLIILGLGVLTIILVYLIRVFLKQRNQLAKANDEIKHMNDHLEDLVREKTESLEKTNKELDTFLYRSAHDLRRPLSSILGLGNIAEMTLEGEALMLFKKATQTAVEMDGLLQKLQMVSHINHPVEPRTIDFKEQVDDLTGEKKLAVCKQNLNFSTHIDRGIDYESSPMLTEIILHTLIENAIYYSSFNKRDKPSVDLDISQVNGHVDIVVRDNGGGIDPRIQEKVWEMFFVGNEQSRGNGLGLYIAKRAVEELEGSIIFRSEQNKFTEFHVKLPVNHKNPEPNALALDDEN